MSTNFVETKLYDVVKLAPKLCTKSYKKHILSILKKKYEGICSKHGYIYNDSIYDLYVKCGKIEIHSFHGYTLFNVTFQAKLFNPSVGNIISCVVKNMNSFGILCTYGITDHNNIYSTIIDIIIPKQSLNIIENKNLIDSVQINSIVNVEIMGKKFLLNNKKISAIGNIVQNQDNVSPVEEKQETSVDEDDQDTESVLEPDSELPTESEQSETDELSEPESIDDIEDDVQSVSDEEY